MTDRQDGGYLRDGTTGALVVSGPGGTSVGAQQASLAIGKGGATVPVGLHSRIGFNTSSSAFTSQSARMFIPLTDPKAQTVLPIFGNWLGGIISGPSPFYFEQQAPNPITIAAAVETSDGSVVPFTFNGEHLVTLSPTVPIAVPDFPLNIGAQVSATDRFSVTIPLTGFWLRTYVTVDASRTDVATVTSGSPTVADTSVVASDLGRFVSGTGVPSNAYVGAVSPGVSFTLYSVTTNASVNASGSGSAVTLASQWPQNVGVFGTNDAMTAGAGADLTLPGSAAPSGGSGYMYGPLVVLGKPHTLTRKPIALIFTDSILEGFQDDSHSPYFGPAQRACLNLALPMVKATHSSEWAASIANPSGRRFRAQFFEGCTHVIVSYGTNDLANGQTSTQVLNNLTTIGNYFLNLGITPYVSTIPPRTSSTDAWATTVNQTAISPIATLAAVNQAIRAGLTPYVGVLDQEALSSSAQDSGLWAVGATTDGIHPTDAISRGSLTTACQTLMATWSVT